MLNSGLSFNTRKALSVQLGEPAGIELANLVQKLASRIEELERNKVNVTRIVPGDETNLLTEDTFSFAAEAAARKAA